MLELFKNGMLELLKHGTPNIVCFVIACAVFVLSIYIIPRHYIKLNNSWNIIEKIGDGLLIVLVSLLISLVTMFFIKVLLHLVLAACIAILIGGAVFITLPNDKTE